MTHRVPRSRTLGLGFPDFGVAVATYAADMNAWRAHMAKAETDQEYHPYPAPTAHPEVVAAVKETTGADGIAFVPDFVVFDDGPTPEQILRAKKNALAADLTHMEVEAIHAISPPGTRRFLAHRENDIRAEDARRRLRVMAREAAKAQKHFTAIEKLKGALTGTPPGPQPLALEEIVGEVEKTRPPEDAAFLEEQERRRQKIAEIDRHFAAQHHEVEELTAENIDGWKPTPFTPKET